MSVRQGAKSEIEITTKSSFKISRLIHNCLGSWMKDLKQVIFLKRGRAFENKKRPKATLRHTTGF